jgi:oligopeptide transport system substrate-binding protein
VVFAMRKIMISLLTLVVLSSLGCGGQSVVGELSEDVSESAKVTGTPYSTYEKMETEQTSEVSPSRFSDKPVGGVFRILWSDPPTLDPALTTDTTSAFLVVEIFSGLVALDVDLKLIPDIAESWGIGNDGLVYTFHLRPDAKFHDGRVITASDFKWSMERAAHPDTGSPVADTYLNDIVGAEDVFNGKTTNISGINVIDKNTLEITIDEPKAYFLAKLTYPTSYVLDRNNVESGGANWFDSPNGTGPFKLEEYRIGERIVLTRNDNFYREPAYLDSVVMNLAGGQSMAMYENDEIDLTGVGLYDLERVLNPNEESNKHLVVAPPSFSVSYIGFNASAHPFKDSKFRQALNHAVDKGLIATEVMSDLIEPAYGILPPGFPGYNPDLQGLRYDPELAQRLLDESYYGDLSDADKRIVITVPGSGGTIGLDLEVVIEMWRQVLGIEVEIEQVEWATYLEDLNQNKFQAFAGLGWQADYPDPQDFLDILFHSESSINHGSYSNPELDSILEKARIEQNVQERMELYQYAEELVVQDAAWVPLWYTGDRYALIKPHIRNYVMTPMVVPKMKEIYISD